MRNLLNRAPLLGLTLALCACASDRYLPKNAYLRMRQAYATDSETGGISANVMEAQEARFARVREAAARSQIHSAEDYFWSAAIVVTSDEVSDLELAHELGEEANKLGDARGLAVAAEAIDILDIKHGRPQQYGTQLRFEPVLGLWKLHNVDPRTTDAERVRMGVPPLAEIEAMVEERNQSEMTKRLRERLANSIQNSRDNS